MEKTYLKSDSTNYLTDKAVILRFPKVELHRHLEGTFPVKKLYEISLKNGLDFPRNFKAFKEEVQFPKDSGPDFLTFLAKFRNDWYKSYEDISFITYHSVKALKEDGIIYIELRFSPEHFALKNNFDRGKITRLIIEAGNKAAQEEGILIKYLLTFNRNKQSSTEMLKLYNQLKKLDLDDIVGIDLAGDEINFPPELFLDFFKTVHKDGLYKTTIHAGEVTTSKQIWKAINKLNASRIGHGTKTIMDPKLQKFLKEKRIALELCITSNYQTGSWIDEKNHPIGELYRRGVPVTLNSDDPFIQDSDLSDDYIKAARYFDFGLEDLKQLNLTAIESSFLKEDEKESLLALYNKKFEEFKKTG